MKLTGKEHLSKIRQTRDSQLKGEVLFLPCTIPQFSKDYSGVGKESITILTGSTSQGKSSFFKYLMFNLIENAIKYKIKAKFIVFLLEETEERFYHSIISYLLYKKWGLRYSTVEFSGRRVNDNGEIDILPKDILEKIESLEDEAQKYLSYISAHTNIVNPESMYTVVKNYARDKIKYFNNGVQLTFEDIEDEKPFTHVEETSEIIIPCIDTINLAKVKKKDKYESLEDIKFYGKFRMEKILHCHVFWIQQNSKASGTPDSIKQELYFASTTNLSDNKSTSDDSYDIISVTIPNFYDIKTYRGYSVDKLKNGLAVVFLAKARYGMVNKKIPFFFDGKVNHYEILPSTKLTDFEERIKPYYEKVENFYK